MRSCVRNKGTRMWVSLFDISSWPASRKANSLYERFVLRSLIAFRNELVTHILKRKGVLVVARFSILNMIDLHPPRSSHLLLWVMRPEA